MRFPLLLLLAGFLVPTGVVTAQTNYKTTCITNGANNATLVVDEAVTPDLGNGESLAPGDTLVAYTNDGVCAGYEVWTGSGSASFPVAGLNTATDDPAAQGYAAGEALKIKVMDQSRGVTIDVGANVGYESCESVGLPTCRDDGTYENGTIAVVASFPEGPLPVELARFDVASEGRRAQLTWQTASETNNAGFEVQRTTEESSGEAEWTVLGFVEGAGTTTSPQSYRFRTEPLPPGTHRFRLRQVDVDGASEVSNVVEVTVTLDGAYELSPVYPNPVQGTSRLTLTVREPQTVRVALYDMLGREVATLFRGALAANRQQTIQIDGRQQASGSYIVRVKGETFTSTRRLTVVR